MGHVIDLSDYDVKFWLPVS